MRQDYELTSNVAVKARLDTRLPWESSDRAPIIELRANIVLANQHVPSRNRSNQYVGSTLSEIHLSTFPKDVPGAYESSAGLPSVFSNSYFYSVVSLS